MKKNWEIKKLKEICEVFSDGNWIESKDQSIEGIRLVQTGNIGFGFFKNKKDKAKYISEDTFRKLKCTEIFPDDLLISRLPDPVGKSCIIPDINSKMITAVDCTIIRTNKSILPKFLLYFQMSDKYLKDVKSKVTGTTRSRISRKNLGLIQIPLPPLPEQKRLVSILDKAFAAIDKAIANTRKNLQNTKELFDSYLNEIFSNPGEDWEEKKFGNLCKFVRGPFGGSLKKSIFVQEGYAVYEQRNAIYNQFKDIRYFITENKFNEMQRFEVLPGDLIMSCSGTIGKVAIAPPNIKKGIINQALLKLTPNPSLLVSFLKYWMESENFKFQISKHTKGAAIKNIASVKVLKELYLILPSVEIQKDIILEIETYLSKTKRLESIYQQKLDNLKELKQSILQIAFEGEL